jgi:hypothetical protein
MDVRPDFPTGYGHPYSSASLRGRPVTGIGGARLILQDLVRRPEQFGHKVTLAAKDTESSPDLAGAGRPE